nr:transcriptional regulatory protein AlgP-like [Aegilops tauschii subsp. strangulata]
MANCKQPRSGKMQESREQRQRIVATAIASRAAPAAHNSMRGSSRTQQQQLSSGGSHRRAARKRPGTGSQGRGALEDAAGTVGPQLPQARAGRPGTRGQGTDKARGCRRAARGARRTRATSGAAAGGHRRAQVTGATESSAEARAARDGEAMIGANIWGTDTSQTLARPRVALPLLLHTRALNPLAAPSPGHPGAACCLSSQSHAHCHCSLGQSPLTLRPLRAAATCAPRARSPHSPLASSCRAAPLLASPAVPCASPASRSLQPPSGRPCACPRAPAYAPAGLPLACNAPGGPPQLAVGRVERPGRRRLVPARAQPPPLLT